MADLQEDQLQQIDVASLIRCLDVDGVSSVITWDKLLGFLFQPKGNVTLDLDNYIEAGVYGINMDLYNIPILEVKYGMLIVFTAHGLAVGGSPIVQFVISAVTNPIIYVRTKWLSSWTTWKQISFT